MDRHPFRRRGVKADAIVAFVVAVIVAYLLALYAGIGGRFLSPLLVAAVGGLWYHYRKVV